MTWTSIASSRPSARRISLPLSPMGSRSAGLTRELPSAMRREAARNSQVWSRPSFLPLVLLFFTGPLRYVPAAALGAVLFAAAISLFNVSALKEFYQLDRRELALSLLATIGVVTVGTMKAIFLAVILALLRFVSLISRPQSRGPRLSARHDRFALHRPPSECGHDSRFAAPAL